MGVWPSRKHINKTVTLKIISASIKQEKVISTTHQLISVVSAILGDWSQMSENNKCNANLKVIWANCFDKVFFAEFTEYRRMGNLYKLFLQEM